MHTGPSPALLATRGGLTLPLPLRSLTDSQGRTVSFADALVVMTSNVGSAAIAKGGLGLGFQLGDAEEAGYGRVRSLVTEELKQFFRCGFRKVDLAGLSQGLLRSWFLCAAA